MTNQGSHWRHATAKGLVKLLASYLYSLAGFENKYFNASFRALQPIVAAMVGHLSMELSKWDRIADYLADSSGHA